MRETIYRHALAAMAAVSFLAVPWSASHVYLHDVVRINTVREDATCASYWTLHLRPPQLRGKLSSYRYGVLWHLRVSFLFYEVPRIPLSSILTPSTPLLDGALASRAFVDGSRTHTERFPSSIP